MSDIVERLRKVYGRDGVDPYGADHLMLDAADEIQHLTAECDRLRAALERVVEWL